MKFQSNVAGGIKGIGRVIVEHFLSAGANVSYGSRSVRGDEFVGFKEATCNARAVGTKLDITNLQDIEKWVERAASTFGQIDTVVCNAVTNFVNPTNTDWEKSLVGDILGLRTLILAALPHLEKTAAQGGNSSIVVISSIAGFENRFPMFGSAYPTVKRAQAIMAKDLSRELGPKKIRINSVIPGVILTDNFVSPDGILELSTTRAMLESNAGFFEQVERDTPLGRFGNPSDVAHAVVFLASPLASYITGASLAVDGGSSFTI